MNRILAGALRTGGFGIIPIVLYFGTEFSGNTNFDTKDSNFIWSSYHIAMLARDPRMADVVQSLVGRHPLADKSLQSLLPRVEEAIDSITEEHIQRALLEHTKRTSDADDLRFFAQVENAGSTCKSEKSAGGNGLEVCAAQCNAKGIGLPWEKPADGACYTLCSVAVAPCGGRPSRLAPFFKTGLEIIVVSLRTATMRGGAILLNDFTVAVGVVFNVTWMASLYVSHQVYKLATSRFMLTDNMNDALIRILVIQLLAMVVLLAKMGWRRWRRFARQARAARNLNIWLGSKQEASVKGAFAPRGPRLPNRRWST